MIVRSLEVAYLVLVVNPVWYENLSRNQLTCNNRPFRLSVDIACRSLG
ncbi:hypothetical protein [Nostoc sp.]